MENILVFCAHSDDQILGPGGTLARYAREGKKVYTYIFSYGEMSNPHLKEEIIRKARIEEAQRADRVIGGQGVEFLGLAEGSFEKNMEEIVKRLAKIIRQKKPSRIFTHNPNDPHLDHRSVYRVIMQAVRSFKNDISVYCFDIWNPIDFKKRENPKLVVNISNTFKTKLRAIEVFKSQWHAILLLKWTVYLKAIMNGFKRGYRYAEVFTKVR